MTLIKSDKHILEKEASGIIQFYRNNPVIAANQLLRVDNSPLELAPIQQVVLEEWWNSKFSLLTASRGMGKGCTLNTKILTTVGWIEMRDITLSHKVITPKGVESSITGIYPQGTKDVYEFQFIDGRKVKVDDTHLWNVIGVGGYNNTRPNEWQTLSTLQIKEYLDTKAEKQHQTIRIPLVEDIFLKKEDTKFIIQPYVLGVLIGDGCIRNSVMLSSSDLFIVDKIAALLGKEYLVKKVNDRYDYRIIDTKVKNIGRLIGNTKNRLTGELKRLKLYGKYSYEKNIPEEYLNLNRKQTLEILQGLFDTDGTVQYGLGRNNIKPKKANCVRYCTTSENLARQIQILIWKLGGICKISTKIPSFTYKGIKKQGRLAYILNIRYKNKRELFSLPRKRDKLTDKDQYSKNLGLRVKKIEKSISEETQCIKIEDPDGLFIIDDYIVTHNTFISAVYSALQALLYPSNRIGIFAPAFRQSKLIFKEFENIYENSPILQQSVERAPTYLNDQCVCSFKPINKGIKPSEVLAFPVGSDGGKIRGLRLRRVLLDEIPHLPETIFRSAIHPMMSTSQNPMKRVKEVELLKKKSNKYIIPASEAGYIGITSGYYQFNYWWNEITKFYEHIKNGEKDYSIRFVPYYELPEGFYNESIVKDAEENSPKHMFMTEWLAEWIADSMGAFPMSLLEAVRSINVEPKYCKNPDLDKGKEFIFGIDSARESDSTAICVIELGFPSKLVYIEEIEDKPFPLQAKIIFDLIDKFKPLRIYIDEFGGGNVIRDHLADPKQIGLPDSIKVIEVDDTKGSGKRLLQLCNFNPAFIEDINNNTKTLLEQRAILLPDATHPIEKVRTGPKGTKVVDLVQELINQVSSVVVSSTPSGRLHYDLPKKRGSSTNPTVLKKDLYTSFILACGGIYDLQWKPKVEKIMVDKGVIREIQPRENLTNQNISDNIGRIIGGSTISNTEPNKRILKGGGVIISKNGRRR